MKLNIEVSDNIGYDDGRKPFSVTCSVCQNITLGKARKVNPIETITRLDCLAKKITETINEYYSSIYKPISSPVSQLITSK